MAVIFGGVGSLLPRVKWSAASASGDGTVRVWDPATGQARAALRVDGPLSALTVIRDVIVAGGAQGCYFLAVQPVGPTLTPAGWTPRSPSLHHARIGATGDGPKRPFDHVLLPGIMAGGAIQLTGLGPRRGRAAPEACRPARPGPP
jgi:hypothetical protein